MERGLKRVLQGSILLQARQAGATTPPCTALATSQPPCTRPRAAEPVDHDSSGPGGGVEGAIADAGRAMVRLLPGLVRCGVCDGWGGGPALRAAGEAEHGVAVAAVVGVREVAAGARLVPHPHGGAVQVRVSIRTPLPLP